LTSAFCESCRTTPCTCSIGGAFGIQKAKGVVKQPAGMNKTEARFQAHLDARVLAGEILWYRYAAITFKIGEDCRYTPDFAVMHADHTISLIDVKGTSKGKPWIEEDSRAKIRAAPSIFPFTFQVAFFHAGTWVIKDF